MGSVPCENYFCLGWRWPYLDNLIGEEQAEQYAAKLYSRCRIRFGATETLWNRVGMGTRIAHMEFDLFVPGNLLFVFGHSVQTLNLKTSHADLIAGGDTGTRYVEGQGVDV